MNPGVAFVRQEICGRDFICKLLKVKPPMNTEQASPNQKESHRRDAENAEVRSLGASRKAEPRVSNTQQTGCVRSQEHAEENPLPLGKDFSLHSQMTNDK